MQNFINKINDKIFGFIGALLIICVSLILCDIISSTSLSSIFDERFL